jgi:hypothetical protein
MEQSEDLVGKIVVDTILIEELNVKLLLLVSEVIEVFTLVDKVQEIKVEVVKCSWDQGIDGLFSLFINVSIT